MQNTLAIATPESIEPKSRALDLLKNIQGLINNIESTNETVVGSLNAVLLDTIKGLIVDIIVSVDQSERLWYLITEKLVDLLGILASFPGLKPFLLPLYDIIVDATRDEIRQNKSGSWMDDLSSLESGYSILQKLVVTWWKTPELHWQIRSLIDDITIYGLEKSDLHIYRWLFEAEKSESWSLQLFVKKIWGTVANIRNNFGEKPRTPDSREQLKPKREELVKRRLESLFHIALWALSLWDELSFKRDMDTYFEYTHTFNQWNSEYFSFRIKENKEIFMKHPFLYEYFIGKMRSFSKPKEVADSLFEITKIHFSEHKNVKFVFDTLENIAGNLNYWMASDFIRECLEWVIPDPTVDAKEISRGIAILWLIDPETNWWTQNLVRVWKLCEQYDYKELSQEAYGLAEKNMNKITHDNQRLEAQLSLYKAQWSKDKLAWVWREVEARVEKWPRDDLWENTYTRISVLASREYGRKWDMESILKTMDTIKKTHSYPDDHVRDMILGAIEGMVEAERYEQIPEVITLIPQNIRGSGVNEVVYSLISAWKLELALEWAGNRIDHGDANIISDQSSDLIGRVLEESMNRGDAIMIRKCLEALLEFPINEWVINRVKKIYNKNPQFFTGDYLSRFSRHCISRFHTFVRSSHLVEVIQFLQEISINGTPEIMSITQKDTKLILGEK